MKKVAIIDYGSGNLHSAAKSFEKVANDIGYSVSLTSDVKDVAVADHIVLPGVGAFGDCKAGLEAVDGMVAALQDEVLGNKKPFLGICVGMQLLATKGYERGEHDGLGWIEGDIVPIEPDDLSLKIPHMGWNDFSDTNSSHPLFKDITVGEHTYFVHSYHFKCKNPENILAQVEYGGVVTASVAKDNIMGVQFHPEKSQQTGMKLIRNFLEI
jgi:glutamine amidotransferase